MIAIVIPSYISFDGKGGIRCLSATQSVAEEFNFIRTKPLRGLGAQLAPINLRFGLEVRDSERQKRKDEVGTAHTPSRVSAQSRIQFRNPKEDAGHLTPLFRVTHQVGNMP